MRLFLSFVHDLYTEFDRSLHCDPHTPTFAFEMVEEEDQLCTLEISREQTGWGFLSYSQPKNVLVSWSATGLPEDAHLLARGRVNELPGDLLSARQVLRCVCAPKDIDKRLLQFAKAHLDQAPFVNFLFSDADVDDPASYLLGRPDVYHVDPMTHAVRLVSEVAGDRVLDMQSAAFFDGGSASDAPGEYGRPVRTVRARLPVDFVQEAQGICDVGPLVSSTRSAGAPFETLDPGFADALQSMLTAEASEGWSVSAGGYRYDLSTRRSAWLTSGSVYVMQELNPIWFQYQYVDSLSWKRQSETLESMCLVSFEVHRISNVRLPMEFNYSQARQEVIHAALDLPIAETGIEDEEAEVLELSLKNIFEDPRLKDYELGRNYVAGDMVRYDGTAYRCRADHYATDFRQIYRPIDTSQIPTHFGDALVALGAGAMTYWEIVPQAVSPSMAAFAESSIGQEVTRHLMYRLKKEGLRRLRARRITMKFRWEDAAHVRRSDSITILVPRMTEHGMGMSPVTAKVLSIRRSWPELSPATITIEVGAIFADASRAPPSPEPAYGPTDYATEDYTLADQELGDVRYTVNPDPVRTPVDVHRLTNRGYAVESFRMGGDAQRQFAAASVLAGRGGDVRRCSQVAPSWASLKMRPLPSGGTILREVDVVGELAYAGAGVWI